MALLGLHKSYRSFDAILRFFCTTQAPYNQLFNDISLCKAHTIFSTNIDLIGIKRTIKDTKNTFDAVNRVFIVQINPTIQPSTNPPRKWIVEGPGFMSRLRHHFSIERQ